ncbi:MAG: nucleotidyltransferase domain-containing protein [Bryobacterales bacterium]|nr:nucleotidyltransferase domain-containing protein [Bryobacterales bacterium]
MQKNPDQLTAKLEKTFGTDLVSVILYGSAASGEYHEQYSDLNILCVLQSIRPADLAAAEPIFRWWRDLGNPAPLLLAELEVRTSTDCFPIEFHDMRHQRRVLAGRDVIEGLEIDDSFYRAQVEYQLRTAFIRLRQKAAGLLHDARLLTSLLAESVSTFLVLGRHVLILSGTARPGSKRETVEALGTALGIDVTPFRTLMDLREKQVAAKSVDSKQVFAQYLLSVQALVDAVDRLEK